MAAGRAKTSFKTAAVIAVGNEITTGKITDTNSPFLARFFFKNGYRFTGSFSVGDSPGEIKKLLRSVLKKNDIVAVTGGLGPTHDDITKKAVCDFLGVKTEFNPKVLANLKRFFVKRGRTLPKINYDYADIPVNAVPVSNPVGVAPGLFFENKLLLLPGVPSEMAAIIEKHGRKLIPHGGTFFRETVIHTAGAGETTLSEKLKNLKEVLGFAEVAFLPHNGRVDIRIIASGENGKESSALLKRAEKLLIPDIKVHIWGFNEETIETAIAKKLKKKKKSFAVAESCTGGGIGAAATSVSGSSDYFAGGVISYSDEAKIKLLGAPRKTVEKFGAVSEQTAIAMAKGARKKFKTDFGISSTGIAGPKGGSKEKPVGLVYIAVSSEKGETFKRLMLGKERNLIRQRTVFEALYLLWENL